MRREHQWCNSGNCTDKIGLLRWNGKIMMTMKESSSIISAEEDSQRSIDRLLQHILKPDNIDGWLSVQPSDSVWHRVAKARATLRDHMEVSELPQ